MSRPAGPRIAKGLPMSESSPRVDDGAETRPTIAITDMCRLVTTGRAVPLLGGCEHGAVFHAGMWWVVQDRASGVFTATHPDAGLRELTAAQLLLRRVDEIVATIAEERDRERAA